MINKKLKFGFTLAEVIITMIIIAVVVGVSMKVSKSKLSNIKSYNYYAAYTVLSDAVRAIIFDFDSCDDVYMLSPGGSPIADCSTVPANNPVTLPRLGSNFCQKFASYINTTGSVNGNNECSGTSVSASDSSFSARRPDLVLVNGMKVYNISQNPSRITNLVGNSSSRVYVNGSGQSVDIDEYGYVAYIDIDGNSGNSLLWEDVYPFYITMSGKLYPAYNLSIGATGKDYITAGIYYESVQGYDNSLIKRWLLKSVTFKEAACQSGFVKDTTQYCKTTPAVSKNAACNSSDNDCQIVVIKPIKFF